VLREPALTPVRAAARQEVCFNRELHLAILSSIVAYRRGRAGFAQDLPMAPVSTLKELLPKPTRRGLAEFSRHLLGVAAPGRVAFGNLRRLTPISRDFGRDRGLPPDQVYIESFLERRGADVRGRVLEIGEDTYTRRFGAEWVTQADVLHVHERNPRTTFVGDLATADHIPKEAFDCIILTQTLQYIYELRPAIRTLHRILKPSGVLLATAPGVTAVATRSEWGPTWYWSFTENALRRLLGEVFPEDVLALETHGNVLVAISFLHGLAAEELTAKERDTPDPDFPVVWTARAVKEVS
jgi:SAM-dependent methyltransferase